MPDYDIVLITVPREGTATLAELIPWFTECCRNVRRVQPQAQLGLTFNGYDDDPRETYSIPRVIEFCKRAIDTPGFALLHDYFGDEPGVPLGSKNVWVIGRRLINTRTGKAEFPAKDYETAIARSKGML